MVPDASNDPARDVRLEGAAPSASASGPAHAAPASPLQREAFGERFLAARRKLWWVAVSVLGRREQVDDVLQEAALVALRKLDEFDPATSFEAWMAQIVRFIALNDARKRVRRSTQQSGPGDEPVTNDRHAQSPVRADGSVVPDQQAFDDSMLNALQSIPETARACLLLRAVEGLSYKEISDLLGVPEGTAMSHVHRARAAMRRSLEEGGRA